MNAKFGLIYARSEVRHEHDELRPPSQKQAAATFWWCKYKRKVFNFIVFYWMRLRGEVLAVGKCMLWLQRIRREKPFWIIWNEKPTQADFSRWKVFSLKDIEWAANWNTLHNVISEKVLLQTFTFLFNYQIFIARLHLREFSCNQGSLASENLY